MTVNNGMHVLEMEMEPEGEETEALVVNGNSTSVGTGSKRGASGPGVVETLLRQTSSVNGKNVAYGILGILFLVILVINITSEGSLKVGVTKKGSSSAGDDLIEFVDPGDLKFVEQGDAEDDAISFVEPTADSKDDSKADDAATDTTKEELKKEDDAVDEKKDETPTEEQLKDEAAAKAKKNKIYSKIPSLPPDAERGEFDKTKQEALRDKWGGWHFWDGDGDRRPKEDFVSEYPNKDIPGDKFPDESWQVDAVYVNHYLDSATDLVESAMEAIFTEYGHGKPQSPEGMAERTKMFHWDKLDLAETTTAPPAFAKRGARDIGGWTTKRSWDGLIRRLLHAMITQDTFTVVLAGHSAAAGEGNHFRQSYMMQFHQIMKPVFDRLGVKLITRNISFGGMGTIQHAMGSGDLYGHEIDLLLWDSGMTENCCPPHIDLFFRQALLGGNRVPVLWASGPFDLLRTLHQEVDADVGEWGTGMYGIPEVESAEQAKTIPWAARFIKCKDEVQELCGADRFRSTCWIDREDGVKPEANQRERMRGQVKWHPGWRVHQLQGRVLAFTMLEALEIACNRWMEGTMTGQPLDDDYWHMTKYYENIRNKVKNLDPSIGHCYEIEGTLPKRMCNTPMKGRTQYTPRADYEESSLTSIIKPAADGYVPKNEKKPLYDGPDVHNPNFDVPDDALDVLAIVYNRRRLEKKHSMAIDERALVPTKQKSKTTLIRRGPPAETSRRNLDEAIVPGKGWEVFDEPQGVCDGTYEQTCGHSTDNECFLSGHHTSRAAIVGTEWSGWLVMQLKDLKEGIIVIKLHTWHFPAENPKTNDWKTVNNERGRRRLGDESEEPEGCSCENSNGDQDNKRRNLMRSYDTPELPDTFAFDYAIDGKITTLNKEQFLEQKQQIQRVVETLTLLDDPNFTKEPKDVEVAIRLRGVERKVAFGVSHIYWA